MGRFAWIVASAACSAPAPPPVVAPPPAVTERDGDRIADADDSCPTDAEDVDGFEDADGCPEPDNDHDRIADIADKCPNEPETYNGEVDDDGCPDHGCVLVKQFPFCILERIFFARGKAVPDASSHHVLDATAEAMRLTDPDIELVELRGFRSGNEPRTLSRQRAAAVHALLVQRGVAAARLVVADGGVGAPSDAPNGQRRVELAIIEQRVSYEAADEIACTPMGRYFRRLTDEERRAACRR